MSHEHDVHDLIDPTVRPRVHYQRTLDDAYEQQSSTRAGGATSYPCGLRILHAIEPLGQTGDGHWCSPVGGYDAASDQVLLLDVARFKYQTAALGTSNLII